MTTLRNLPVSQKLAAIIVAATAAAVLLMSGAFVAYDYSTSRRQALSELQTFGRIAAGNSTAAVAFSDAKSAGEVLNTLGEHTEIQTGCTYDADFQVLARYHRIGGISCPATVASVPVASLTRLTASYSQPIRLNEISIGYIFVQSDLSLMRTRRDRFLAITALFLLVSLMAGTFLGTRLQRWIVKPIAALAAVMERVSSSGDYATRAEFQGGDEIGKLVLGFNHMLDEIQDGHIRLQRQALNDELTKLPNRRLFSDRLSQALALAERQKSTVAVIYMDLDGFKLVNDTLGHSVGDLLLRQVAERLQQRVRTSDTFARIGGDEFMLVAAPVRNAGEAGLLANELLAQFMTPFSIHEHELTLTASIGISLYPQDAVHPEQMVQQADTAMYVAKSTGKNKLVFFSPEFGDAVRERLELENQLRGALERHELSLHYQPEFDLRDQRLVRFEALARWNNPTLGMIPPLKFIPIAEESGLIIPIGRWVMEQACREAVRWQALSSGPVMVGVNVSNIQFMQSDFVGIVARVLQVTGLDAKLLQLELTESVLLPGRGECLTKMSQLRSLGVSLAIDDFGTGYSSLSLLPHLPFDHLKIDRSFLKHIVDSKDPRGMMQSIIELAHTLEIRVIIEGIETADQLALIRAMGCDEVQGYLVGRPTAAPDEYLSHEVQGLTAD
jgi:diguanylate cyclase (GGDEF)-like protein